MHNTSNNRVNPSILFLALFSIGAISFTVWTRNRIPDNITLHINDTLSVVLMGEKDIKAIRFHPAKFKLGKKNSGHLWLNGYGDIHWRKHKIIIRKNAVSFNGQSISKTRREKIANIMLYPDGRMSKGKPQ